MKKELVFASMMVEYAISHGYSIGELNEYFRERVFEMGFNWDDSFNEGLDVIDSLYSHLSALRKYDFSKHPFV